MLLLILDALGSDPHGVKDSGFEKKAPRIIEHILSYPGAVTWQRSDRGRWAQDTYSRIIRRGLLQRTRFR